MASRREVLAGTVGMLAMAACEPEEATPTTKSTDDTGGDPTTPPETTDTDTTDTDTTDTDTTTTTDTGTPPIPCESSITDDQIVICLADFPELAATDGAVTLNSSQGSLFVIRVDGNTVSTVSNRCTHLGCALAWRSASSLLHCNCHGSEFSPEGDVLQGPANRPLDSYPTTLVNDTITIDLS